VGYNYGKPTFILHQGDTLFSHDYPLEVAERIEQVLTPILDNDALVEQV
jgi:hypothetical protein